MGKALEYLGAGKCRDIMASLVEVNDKKSRKNDLWFCCPLHGDTDASAHYDVDQDLYHCFGCQAGGDLINFFTELNNFDDTEGFRAFLKEFCPERLERGSSSAPKTQSIPKAVVHRWVPDAAYLPPEKWRQKALINLRECVEALQKRPDVLAQLADWGIDAQTARTCMIGWNDHDRYYPVTAMDLAYEPARSNPSKERKIWWPTGLVFASMRDGLPAKIKIRAEKPLANMPRYYQVYAGPVPRGHRSPYLIAGDPGYRIWVPVETDRDAYLVWSACRGLGVGAMAVGSAGARPDAYAASILLRAELILCGLDNDAAGRLFANSFWAEEFPQSVRWPVPPRFGKDVGDAVRPLSLARSDFPLDNFYNRGLDPFYMDVRRWVQAGIPARVWRAVQPRKSATSPVPAQVVPPPPPPKPKTRMEKVLEEVAQWPEYHEHFTRFWKLAQGKPIAFFRSDQGGVYVDCLDHRWEAENWETMQQIWKEFTGLEELIEYYFPDKIRGAK